MSEKKDRIRAIIGAIIFHTLLLIVLIFLGLSTPLPLPEEEGVEVNLGFSDVGSGNQQRQLPIEQPKAPTPVPVQETAAQEEEEIVDQISDEAPAIQEKPAEKPEKPKQEEPKEIPEDKPEVVEEKVVEKPVDVPEKIEPEPEPEPVVDPRLMYTGKKSKTGDSSEGPEQEAGDKGKVTGDPNSSGYDGLGGQGNGISFNLGNRKAKSLPKPNYDSDDQGKVVVSIWVNKMGEVTRAEVMQKGTNVTDIKLRNMARQAALKAKFTPDVDAAEVQKGSITYNFIKLN
ncbi:energy transducer TonB [Lentimicrobium sp. S6]|uniref:energy transducer TonB family protein n=1 Tax=Lentimicrobium sp. S6 TaxID=2735872 RepID=UPI001552FA36|nr:energy transducer TonB [Lentimicrobium sp. S6]MBF8984751.1 energy transducer TonB [Lutibacter sp. B2]NPD47396.1 energy transducer TonB [Lentimicrobium sp. S6]